MRGEMLKAREERIRALEGSTDRLRSNLEERTATLKVREERIRALEGSTDRLRSNLKERTATLKVRDCSGRLRELRRYREERFDLWKQTG